MGSNFISSSVFHSQLACIVLLRLSCLFAFAKFICSARIVYFVLAALADLTHSWLNFAIFALVTR